jgi:GntR family transcriptional regulator/MocR family aminotransferase
MVIALDGQGPRYAQFTRALRTMIQRGVLPFEARLPPTRELARDFGCSRNIVLLAYEQLVLEGYLVTRQGAGTFVSPAWPKSRERARA